MFGLIELISDFLLGSGGPMSPGRRLVWLLGWVVLILVVLAIAWAITELV